MISSTLIVQRRSRDKSDSGEGIGYKHSWTNGTDESRPFSRSTTFLQQLAPVSSFR